METYNNTFKKTEDECLWELHEIRNQLHNELKNESFSEINEKGKFLYDEIKRKFSSLNKSEIA